MKFPAIIVLAKYVCDMMMSVYSEAYFLLLNSLLASFP